MTTHLPDYDPHLLEKQIAAVREMQRRGQYSSAEAAEREIDEFHETMTRLERKTRRPAASGGTPAD